MIKLGDINDTSNIPRELKLSGHAHGFKVSVYSYTEENLPAFKITLKPHHGHTFLVQITFCVPSPFTQRAWADIMVMLKPGKCRFSSGKSVQSQSDKLQEAVKIVLDHLSIEEQAKLYELVYKAGKSAGRNDVRKRIHQLMKIDYEEKEMD